jgi:hypothetical protein
MSPDAPIPFWPTPKPAHHEASIPYWPVEPEAPGFWSDAAWAELCAYADRFEDIDAEADRIIVQWAADGRCFDSISDGWWGLSLTEAARRVREEGPFVWGAVCAAKAVSAALRRTSGHDLEGAGWNHAMRTVAIGLNEMLDLATTAGFMRERRAETQRRAEGC